MQNIKKYNATQLKLSFHALLVSKTINFVLVQNQQHSLHSKCWSIQI